MVLTKLLSRDVADHVFDELLHRNVVEISDGGLILESHNRYAPVMKHLFWNYVASLKYCSFPPLNVLKNGQVLRQSRIFLDSDITEYSKVMHDSNPLHFDSEVAANSGFKYVPVPGLLVASLFPRIIASHFPGAVYVKQNLEFRSPVFVGDCIIGEVQASSIREMKQKYMVKFVTTCFKDGGTVVVGGEAIAILPSLDVKQIDGHV